MTGRDRKAREQIVINLMKSNLTQRLSHSLNHDIIIHTILICHVLPGFSINSENYFHSPIVTRRTSRYIQNTNRKYNKQKHENNDRSI